MKPCRSLQKMGVGVTLHMVASGAGAMTPPHLQRTYQGGVLGAGSWGEAAGFQPSVPVEEGFRDFRSRVLPTWRIPPSRRPSATSFPSMPLPSSQRIVCGPDIAFVLISPAPFLLTVITFTSF